MTAVVERRGVGPKLTAKLEQLTAELAEAERVAKAAEARVDEIKVAIREIVDGYDLPVQEGQSQYLNVPAQQRTLRVTRTAPAPTLNPERFLAEVGRDVFLDVVTVKKVELDVPRWQVAVAQERATN